MDDDDVKTVFDHPLFYLAAFILVGGLMFIAGTQHGKALANREFISSVEQSYAFQALEETFEEFAEACKGTGV